MESIEVVGVRGFSSQTVPDSTSRHTAVSDTRMAAAPTTPVKELPKEVLIGTQLKGELLAGDLKLKPTDSSEKNVLPTAEDMKAEKTQEAILTGIAGFQAESLKPTETKERSVLPGAQEIQAEKTIQGMLQGVEAFAKDSLKDVRTREPASPTVVMKEELARDGALKTVSEFDKSNLKRAETQEKNPLPSTEAIAQELEHIKFKVLAMSSNFIKAILAA